MANPTPEVMPGDVPANVAVVATGRSDFPNQINNVLAFPGVFRGLLDTGAPRCTTAMKLAAADALAALVPDPTPSRIVPGSVRPRCRPRRRRRRAPVGVQHRRRRPAARHGRAAVGAADAA